MELRILQLLGKRGALDQGEHARGVAHAQGWARSNVERQHSRLELPDRASSKHVFEVGAGGQHTRGVSEEIRFCSSEKSPHLLRSLVVKTLNRQRPSMFVLSPPAALVSVMSNHLRSSVVASPGGKSHKPANLELSQIAMIRRFTSLDPSCLGRGRVMDAESEREAKDGMKTNPSCAQSQMIGCASHKGGIKSSRPEWTGTLDTSLLLSLWLLLLYYSPAFPRPMGTVPSWNYVLSDLR